MEAELSSYITGGLNYPISGIVGGELPNWHRSIAPWLLRITLTQDLASYKICLRGYDWL